MEKEKLGLLVDIKTGKLNANASDENGKYPFFTCSKETLKINRYSYDCECVLVAGNGDLNAKYYNGKFDAYQRTYILTNKNNKRLNLKYLYYFMQRYLEILRTQSIGGVIKYIKLENLSDAEIKIVSLDEQEKIINKLQKIESIIDIRKQQLEKLQILVKSQFFVEMFENENKYVNLEDVCVFINGDRGKNYPSADKISKDPSGIPFINAGLLINNTVDWKNMNYISEDTYNKLGSGKIQKEDILYCLRGSLGKHSIIDFDGKGAIASSLVILRADKSKIQPDFLLIQLGMDEILRQQNQANNGSSQPNLSAGSVKKYIIKLPSLELQNKFAEFVKQVDKQEFEGLKLEKLLKNLIDEGAKNVKF